MRRSVRRRARDDAGRRRRSTRLERTNGFVVPLDRTGEWYRYHHLFGQLLRDELERTEPELVPALNARAMAWCVANDLPEEAIGYGQAAGETEAVAGLVDALSPPLYYDGRLQTAEEWLGWFGDDELVQYPALAVFGAWWRALTGRAEEAERWLALADGATSKIPLSDGSATIEPWVATLRAHMMPNGVEQALADADQALDQLSPDSFWIPTALLGRGVAHALLGAADRAVVDAFRNHRAGAGRRQLRRGLRGAGAARAPRGQGRSLGRGRATCTCGRSGRRRDGPRRLLVERARPRRDSACRTPRGEDARMPARRWHVPTAYGRMLDHGIPWVTVEVGLELTRIHLALGEAAAARTTLRETEDVLELRPDMGIARRGRARASRPPRGDLRVGRCLGDEPDGRRASAASLPRHPSHGSGDRDPALHLAQHRQDRSGLDLPQAERLLAQRGDRTCGRGGAPGELDLPAAANLTQEG